MISLPREPDRLLSQLHRPLAVSHAEVGLREHGDPVRLVVGRGPPLSGYFHPTLQNLDRPRPVTPHPLREADQRQGPNVREGVAETLGYLERLSRIGEGGIGVPPIAREPRLPHVPPPGGRDVPLLAIL